MTYEVAQHREYSDTWVVEAIDHDGDGEIFAAEFRGRGARERASEYAEWKNSADQTYAHSPSPQVKNEVTMMVLPSSPSCQTARQSAW